MVRVIERGDGGEGGGDLRLATVVRAVVNVLVLRGGQRAAGSGW